MSALRCTICGTEFPELPPDAVKVGKPKGVAQIYKFPDGTVHNLVSMKVGRRKVKQEKTNEQ
jgi:hypothetical protein